MSHLGKGVGVTPYYGACSCGTDEIATLRQELAAVTAEREAAIVVVRAYEVHEDAVRARFTGTTAESRGRLNTAALKAYVVASRALDAWREANE